jgi:hypothetical protein
MFGLYGDLPQSKSGKSDPAPRPSRSAGGGLYGNLLPAVPASSSGSSSSAAAAQPQQQLLQKQQQQQQQQQAASFSAATVTAAAAAATTVAAVQPVGATVSAAPTTNAAAKRAADSANAPVQWGAPKLVPQRRKRCGGCYGSDLSPPHSIRKRRL